MLTTSQFVIAPCLPAPGSDQEGVTLVAACPRSSTTLVMAEDAGASVRRYARYPIACP